LWPECDVRRNVRSRPHEPEQVVASEVELEPGDRARLEGVETERAERDDLSPAESPDRLPLHPGAIGAERDTAPAGRTQQSPLRADGAAKRIGEHRQSGHPDTVQR